MDTSLVSPGDYMGETMTCSGAFDERVSRREVPLAIIKLHSARLQCDENLSVEVGVVDMPCTSIGYNIGNSFDLYPQFKDSVHIDAIQA